MRRLDRAYRSAPVIPFNDHSKFILFSDCHRGDNSFADDFSNNRNIYFHALKHYYKHGFRYCELGDGDELWENLHFDSIFEAHKNVYTLLRQFHLENRLHMIWGNHDMVYKDPEYVDEHLSSYFEPIDGRDKALFQGIRYEEGLVLQHEESGSSSSCATGIRRTGGIILFGDGADSWSGSSGSPCRFGASPIPLPRPGITRNLSASKSGSRSGSWKTTC